MSEIHSGLTKDELAILERLGAMNYMDNFVLLDHPTLYKFYDMGLLEDRLPCLVPNEIGSRVICYERALKVRRKCSRANRMRCRVKGHDWWGSGIPPWEKSLSCTPTASFCKRCGVYVEYIGDSYDWRNSPVQRDEQGKLIRIYSDRSEWEWK